MGCHHVRSRRPWWSRPDAIWLGGGRVVVARPRLPAVPAVARPAAPVAPGQRSVVEVVAPVEAATARTVRRVWVDQEALRRPIPVEAVEVGGPGPPQVRAAPAGVATSSSTRWPDASPRRRPAAYQPHRAVLLVCLHRQGGQVRQDDDGPGL